MSKHKKHVLTLYAATLLTGEVPLDQRVSVLSKHLSPKPGEMLILDEHVSKEYALKDKNQGRLYGYIEITPPKGSCFTVTQSNDRPDVEVCKKTKLRWHLYELERHSSTVSWRIKTGPGDFGTEVTWRTPYTVAKVIRAGVEFGEANAQPMFVRTCNAIAADPAAGTGRRIKLSMFNGEEWLFRFPTKDEPLPPYEPPAPPPPPEEKKKGGGHGEEAKKEEGGGEHGDAKPAPPPAPPAPPPPPPEAWTLSTRRGFVMDVSNVIAAGLTTAPSTKGKCRYQYDGVIGNDDTGRIECHYGDRFLYFYSPLPCLKYIKPKS